MIAERSERETRRLRRIADRLKREGFLVTTKPRSSTLPRWLRSFAPDLIAERQGEGVIVEVKSREDAQGDRSLMQLAEIVEGKPNWRFELDISNPREAPREPPVWPAASKARVEEQLRAASQLMESEMYEAALLNAWAAFEGAGRHAMARSEVELSSRPTSSILKVLWSLGYLDPESRDRLRELESARNQAAHGSDPSQSIRPADVFALLEIASRLLNAE